MTSLHEVPDGHPECSSPAATSLPTTNSIGMGSSSSETRGSRSSLEQVLLVLLGLAYVVAGLGLFYSVADDSIDLFLMALAGTLALILLSLGVSIRKEGLLTAENKLIGLFVLIAMGILIGLTSFTEISFEVVMGIVIVVGVIIPGLMLRRTDLGTEQ